MSVIGILPGSYRGLAGNTDGITAYVASRLTQLQQTRSDISKVKILDSQITPLPLGPVKSHTIAAMVPSSVAYDTEEVRQWSATVNSLSALIIVTPQYNHGYPGELKNSLDHLFRELNGLPVAIFTFGARGGNLCGAQLRQVMESGFKSRIISSGQVEIKLPESYVRAGDRLRVDEVSEAQNWLKEYEGKIDEELVKVADAAMMGRVSTR